MRSVRRVSLVGAFISVALVGGLNAQTGSPRATPAFGTSEYTITSIPGVAFTPGDSGIVYNTSGSIGRAVSAAGGHFYSGLDIPAGAIIDFIGFNNLNDGTPNIMAIHLWERDESGSLTDVFDLDNTPHTSWSTDINAVPAAIMWQGTAISGNLILDMEIDASSNTQYFGQVEVHWKRTVSPAPATATFTDVPTTHPFFQFIEALASSGITGGCGGGNYCPNNPVTRGQMAVFLAKALGLDWPN